ncbi:hypothetical protein [Streptomyces albipurpureus]|uniref:Uncharacterized protein n=1 Tax=Streptomyces albipurpureus TaxID=2897419 RepID=A0ABT0V0D4_9ACTN|nr:hypothetical protein [Streptomyces sp. CWNU-1]MCM2393770.1 hypothetical protein [Streptomyces sp. CWNU-1]
MERRVLLRVAGVSALTLATGAAGYAVGVKASRDNTERAAARTGASAPPSEPKALGGTPAVAAETARGRVFVMDSMLDVANKTVTADDVVVGGSFCGASTVNRAMSKGVRAVIAHDAGVGRERAGISGLAFGDRYGLPVAAVETMSAALSNGRTMADGVIGYANARAQELGVLPGQNAVEAARLLLAAPPGRAVNGRVDLDEEVYEMEGTAAGGRVIAVSTLVTLPKGGDYSRDVVALGNHAGSVIIPLLTQWRVRGWIANDAGMGKFHSGVGGVSLCDPLRIPAAAVSTLSASIGSGRSTYENGVVSAVNEMAQKQGVTVGMSARQALRLMAA